MMFIPALLINYDKKDSDAPPIFLNDFLCFLTELRDNTNCYSSCLESKHVAFPASNEEAAASLCLFKAFFDLHVPEVRNRYQFQN